MKNDRPKLVIPLTPADKTMETAGWLFLFTLWTLTLYHYNQLPDTIPTHFNGSGQADGFGNKSNIFLLPIIGTLIFLGMSWLNRRPHLYNYPTKITTDNALIQYTIGTRMIRYLKLAIVTVFALIVFLTYRTAGDESPGLGQWFLPVFLGIVFIPTLYYIIKLYQRRSSSIG